MRKKLIILVIATVFHYGCGSIVKNEEMECVKKDSLVNINEFEQLERVSYNVIVNQMEIKADKNVEIDVCYPKFSGFDCAEKVNVEVDGFVDDWFVGQTMKEFVDGSIEYKKYRKEEGLEGDYVYSRNVSWDAWGSGCVLSVYLHNYVYTGGAHGISSAKLMNFDLGSGEILELDDVIKSRELFMKMLKFAYIKQNDLPDNATKSETGLNYELNDLPFPDGFVMTDRGMMVYYGQYAIACGARGEIEIYIPNSLIKFVLKRWLGQFVKLDSTNIGKCSDE